MYPPNTDALHAVAQERQARARAAAERHRQNKAVLPSRQAVSWRAPRAVRKRFRPLSWQLSKLRHMVTGC